MHLIDAIWKDDHQIQWYLGKDHSKLTFNMELQLIAALNARGSFILGYVWNILELSDEIVL